MAGVAEFYLPSTFQCGKWLQKCPVLCYAQRPFLFYFLISFSHKICFFLVPGMVKPRRFAEDYFSFLAHGPKQEVNFDMIFPVPFKRYLFQPMYNAVFGNLHWVKLISGLCQFSPTQAIHRSLIFKQQLLFFLIPLLPNSHYYYHHKFLLSSLFMKHYCLRLRAS